MTLRGAVQHFPLDTVLLLLAETGKTGRLTVRGDEGSGTLLVSGGRPVSAEFDGARGTSALGGIFTVLRGEFAFEPHESVEGGDLSGDLDELLRTATSERERVAQIREVIPHERTRFRLSERAAQGGQIVMSPDQWRTLLAADGDRDVPQIAERVGRPRFETQELLAGLVRMGMIDTVVDPDAATRREPGSVGDGALLEGDTDGFPLETIVQLAGATRQTGRIEVRSAHGLAALGVADGRLVSAASDGETGDVALADALAARGGRFTFVPLAEAPEADLSGETIELLERAVETRDRLAAAREAIPDPRSRFALSERASGQEQISLTPDKWRTLTKIDGRRDLPALAAETRLGRLRTLMLVGELARDGFVDVIAPAESDVPAEKEIPAVSAPEPITEIPAPPVEWGAAPPQPEMPLAETPVDETAQEAAVDDRLAALTGIFGTPEPAPPPAEWEPAPAQPAPTEWATPAWDTPASEAPAEEAPPERAPTEAASAEVDPRLAAFAWNAPAPEAPAAEAPPMEEVAPPPRPEPLPGTVGAPLPKAEPLPGTMGAPIGARPAAPAAPTAPAAAPVVEAPKKKGGLFGFGAKPPAAAASEAPVTGPRSAQLATFANELVAGYNSGQYGKARVEDHMLSLLMRVDEQADPIDRPVPLANDRIDVDSIERGALPEQQAVPYLALLVRQIYDDAERALGKDKARKGFKDTRDRLFGKDQSLFAAPEVASRLPKV